MALTVSIALIATLSLVALTAAVRATRRAPPRSMGAGPATLYPLSRPAPVPIWGPPVPVYVPPTTPMPEPTPLAGEHVLTLPKAQDIQQRDTWRGARTIAPVEARFAAPRDYAAPLQIDEPTPLEQLRARLIVQAAVDEAGR